MIYLLLFLIFAAVFAIISIPGVYVGWFNAKHRKPRAEESRLLRWDDESRDWVPMYQEPSLMRDPDREDDLSGWNQDEGVIDIDVEEQR